MSSRVVSFVSSLALPYFALRCPVLSCLVSSCLALYCIVLCWIVLVLYCVGIMLSWYHVVLSCCVLSCLVVSCLVSRHVSRPCLPSMSPVMCSCSCSVVDYHFEAGPPAPSTARAREASPRRKPRTRPSRRAGLPGVPAMRDAKRCDARNDAA